MTDDDAGFFRNLSGLATEYVRQKRRSLQSEPQTNVDSMGGSNRYNFGGQQITFDDLRDVKDIRDSGGQIAQLMDYKALLNFGEGAEIHVEDDEETTEIIDGEEMTLSEWLETEAFPKLDLMVLDLGGDALWYPCAVGEIQETVTGGFKRALPAEPWTIIPITNDKGDVVAYRQRTKAASGGYQEQTLGGEDLWHIVVNKASARDETGISEVLRNKDEIQAFKQNESAINQAIELHGFPQRHVKVGREEGSPVSDNDLRRVRTIFDPRSTDANTAYFTGQDVDVETLEAHNFDYSAIHEMDMRNLTTALGLPLEAGNVGADGLGSGKPAELRFALLKLAIKANQRSFGVQFVERVMRPVIRDYSPFDHNETITLDIADPLEDIGEVADLINSIGDYMTNEEIRSKLDMPAPEDDEIAEGYRSPADIEAAEEGDGGGGDFGGLFSDGRTLSVPDNAVPIDSRADAPDGAQIVEGERGGLYYVPVGEGDGDESTGDLEERANEDGTIDAENLQEGDVVQKGDEEITIQATGTDETGTVVQFVDESGEEFFIYEDLMGDMVVPGADSSDTDGTDDTDTPEADDADEDALTEGQEVTTVDGDPATVTAYDPETDVVVVELENGEEIMQTGESVRDDPEPDADSTSERVADEVGLPDNVSVSLGELDDDRANDVIEGLQAIDDAVGLEEGDIFSLTTTPPDDVGSGAAAAFHSGNRTLYVNPDAATGEDRRADFEAGFLSTPDQQGSIMHEMIHSKHSRAALSNDGPSLDELRTDNFDNDEKAMIREEVSDYAATNGMEFVAEVGAGVLSGQEYSDGVMELYDELGGPEVGA